MNLKFDIETVKATEFGVGRDDTSNRVFNFVPVDGEVQDYLREMVIATTIALEKISNEPTQYTASERYDSQDKLYLPLDHDLVGLYRKLHEATNLEEEELSNTDGIFCYFARFVDHNDNKLTALHRSTQFKSLEKPKIVGIIDNTLKIVKRSLFKLDQDFDVLVDSEVVHILRPSGFEFMGQLQQAILDAVPGNISEIRTDMPYVDFESIERYSSSRPRAARYLAAIRSNKWAKNIDIFALKQLCTMTGVEFTESDDMMTLSDDQIMGFLEVIDRRRYTIELVKNDSEQFKAHSRQRI